MSAPQSIDGLKKFESLQRSATKYILNFHWQHNITYRERLIKSKLLPISYWHEIKDLVFYYKCLKSLYSISINNYVIPRNVSRLTRNSSTMDVLVPKCRTKLFQTSYFSRTGFTKLWNNLPCTIRTVNSLHIFKSLLFNRYFSALLNVFTIDNVNT